MDDIPKRDRGSGRHRRWPDGVQKAEAEVSRNQSEADLDEDGFRRGSDVQDDVFVVELEKGDSGIGVGLIDGLVRISIMFSSHMLALICKFSLVNPRLSTFICKLSFVNSRFSTLICRLSFANNSHLILAYSIL